MIKPTGSWTRDEKAKARVILLEPSPWPVDGGELIGRDPRKVPAEDFAQAGLEGNPLLRVIRAKCLDCVAGQEVEIRKCVLIACPHWPYRMGANPFRAAREITDEQREQLAASLAKARSVRNAPPAVLARNISSPKSDEASGGAGMPPEFLEAVNGDDVDAAGWRAKPMRRAFLSLLALGVLATHAWADPVAIAYPDPVLTPGAARTTDEEEICTADTHALRHGSRERSDLIYERYGVARADRMQYTLDEPI